MLIVASIPSAYQQALSETQQASGAAPCEVIHAAMQTTCLYMCENTTTVLHHFLKKKHFFFTFSHGALCLVLTDLSV